jgi:predicted transcriptional regulator of viral defense system
VETETHVVRDRRGFPSPRSRERALAVRAAAQHGVVAYGDLLDLGFSSDQIQRMADAHRLHRVHRGVYTVGHPLLSARGHWMAAVLARGPEALLSHRSGAALTGVRRTSITYVEVTVPSPRAPIDGVRTYVNRRLAPQDRDEIDGIPCTSLARTLLDLAAILPRREIERACDEAEVQELFDLKALEDVLERSHGCRGTATLRAVLAEHRIGTTRTRRGLEERTLRLLDGAAIPRAEVNTRVFCRPGVMPEVDFLWRRERLPLETDGNQFHHTPRQIARDRRKEADLVRAGYRVLRATWDQLQQQPLSVALMVKAALEGGYDSSSA